jgi:acetylornithine deacetylase/succinyl-diaminopimelate desuccinylase-like protein
VAGGRLWGRGAVDTKGSLAAMILAAARLPREKFAGRIVVTASVCEENLTGAELSHVLDRFPADVVVTGEPTALRLGVAQKGRATLLLHAAGRAAHTSRPELGDNAVYKMIEAIQRLRAVPLPGAPDLGPGVLELTEMVSEPLPGNAMVPSGCRARFIARTMPGETEAAVLDRLRGALMGLSGVSVEVETARQACYTGEILEMRDFLPGWRARPGDPWQAAIVAALREADLPAATWAAPCGTNASESAGRRGIPSFIYGPGSLAQAHVVDEWVAVDELLAAEQGYATMARACCRCEASG